MNVWSKKNLSHVNEYISAFSLKLFAMVFLLPVLYFISIPAINPLYWIALVADATIMTAALVLYMKALKHGDLSISIPMIAFTPLFLLITSPLIVGEFPHLIGLAGILLIVIGSYLLNIDKKKKGYLAPIKAIFTNRGTRYMLGVAFLYSFTAVIDKVGLQNSSPLFWAVTGNAATLIGLFVVVMITSKRQMPIIQQKWKALLPAGFFMAVLTLFHMIAVSMTLVAYAIAIKRTSILFTVLWGALLFKEKNFKERLIGAAIMLAGVLLITLF